VGVVLPDAAPVMTATPLRRDIVLRCYNLNDEGKVGRVNHLLRLFIDFHAEHNRPRGRCIYGISNPSAIPRCGPRLVGIQFILHHTEIEKENHSRSSNPFTTETVEFGLLHSVRYLSIVAGVCEMRGNVASEGLARP
jgi:hypothetical protein